MAPSSTPIEQRLITGICYFPCCFYAKGEVECPLQYGRCTNFRLGNGRVHAWADRYGGQGVAHAPCPPLSTTLTGPKEQQAVTFWRQCRRRTDARTRLKQHVELPEGLRLRIFPQGLLPKPLLCQKGSRQKQPRGSGNFSQGLFPKPLLIPKQPQGSGRLVVVGTSIPLSHVLADMPTYLAHLPCRPCQRCDKLLSLST